MPSNSTPTAITSRRSPTLSAAVEQSKATLKTACEFTGGKLLEEQRLEQRTTFDLEMMVETGSARASKIIRAI